MGGEMDKDSNITDSRIHPVKVSEALVQHILTDISIGNLKPGDRLPPQRELAQQLGVGNSSVREALQVLRAMGVVEIKHGIGAFVMDQGRLTPIVKRAEWSSPIAPEQYVEVLEARCVVEVGMARLAALHINDEQLDEMSENLSAMTRGLRQADADLYSNSDLRFHQLLAEASKNAFLVAFLQAQQLPFHAFFETVPYSSAGLMRHHALLEALQKHNSIAAAEALIALLEHTLRISSEKDLISPEACEYLSSLLHEMGPVDSLQGRRLEPFPEAVG
jgi:GntR family transcriptional repressor for pyruvate dehydrogenase complex